MAPPGPVSPAGSRRQVAKAIVQDRLKALHSDVETGVRTQPNYTVRRAADDWLAQGLHGRSPKTIKKNENVLTPILATIGGLRLRDLSTDDIRQALAAMALRYSSAAVAMGHNALTLDLGDPGASPPVPASAAVRRSVRSHGDTKTEKSRRTLALPEMAVTALRVHKELQADDRAASGLTWTERDLVFSTRTGAALDAANVRREFRAVCKAAGIGPNWTPGELRHLFVSLMSAPAYP
jgi:hypothetical protein